MIRSRLGLKVLGLCAVLVGMFAFTGVAQAEVGAFWLVNGAKFTTLLPTVEAETDVAGTLLTELGKQLIDISCKTIKLVGAHLVEPLAQILGVILFHECDFLSLKEKGSPAVLQKACEPFVKLADGTIHKGLIETLNITGLIKLHELKAGEKIGTIEAKPTTAGGLFAHINLGPECGFGEKLKVGGVFFLRDCEKVVSGVCTGSAFSTNLTKHLVEELKALTKLVINEGATPATIDGSAWAFLGGAHTGMTFSGVPN